MTRYLNKQQVIQLLDELNVEHNNVNKYSDLKRLLFNEIPNYHGKKTFRLIRNHVRNVVAERIQEAADFADFFNSYEPPQRLERISQEALIAKDNITRRLEQHENFKADLTNADDRTQESYLYGLIEALRHAQLRFGNKYLTIWLNHGGEHACMRNINPNTISHLMHLINVLEGKASDTTEDFTDSDQAVLMGLMNLKGFELEWYDYKKLQKAFGFFPYYNMIQDLDLSMFGIYHNDEEANYSDNCFILAAIQSKLFSDDEIDFMRSLINTRYIPREDIKYIAEIMNVQIDTYYYNEERKKIDKAVRYNKGCEKVLRILIRCGHGMIYHDELVPNNKYDVHNLNTLISRMLANNELQLISDITNAERFMSFSYEFEKLEYPSCSVKPFLNQIRPKEFEHVLVALYDEPKDTFEIWSRTQNKPINLKANFIDYQLHDKTLLYLPHLQNLGNCFFDNDRHKVKISMYRKTIQQIKLICNDRTIVLRSFHSLTSINASDMNIADFNDLVQNVRRTLVEKMNVNIDNYSTLPNMSLSAAFNYGCFDNVYALSGIVKSFAQKCIHGGLIRTLHDGCFEVDDVKCLDINSSYGTSMATMHGIAQGRPKPFYKKIPEDTCYAFIQLNVTNIKHDKLGRYGFISEGVNFVDSVLFDEIKRYVDCDIEIINGYYFNKGFNNKINSFSKLLYDLRSIELLNKLGKNMLSSLYGKSLQNSQQFNIRLVPASKIVEFIAENGNFIFDMNKSKRTKVYTVRLLKSSYISFNLPQFGACVLSESRKRINEIIDFCNKEDITIYSIKTDSFVINSDDIKKFEQKYKIGRELGEFKIEYEATHVKYTSYSCYRAELIDGSIRMRGNVK